MSPALELRVSGRIREEYENGRDYYALDGVSLRLLYVFGLSPGRYLPIWSVYVVSDSPADLFFDVAVDDEQMTALTEPATAIAEDRADIRREYVTAIVRRRLHQQAFRARVLEAYRTQVPCVGCGTRNCWMRRTSPAMPRPKGNPSSRTGCRCASSITPRSTGIS